MIHMQGRLQIDHDRGVVYFFDQNEVCMLKIEGVRGARVGDQIEIHLVEPGGAHHHEMCGATLAVGEVRKIMDHSLFCAEKIDKTLPLPRSPRIR